MPSDASLSRFGVLPDIIPRWYAPMLNQPTSSPIMTSMFGGRCCCAEAGRLASGKVVESATALVQTRLRILIAYFLRLISDRSCSERFQMVLRRAGLIPDRLAIDWAGRVRGSEFS